MKKYNFLFITILIACNVQAQQPLTLWYTKPAGKWTDALPVGNGRLGAMIYGGIDSEHIQFNEETLWTGRPRTYAHPGAVNYLQPIRELLFAGKQEEAEALAAKEFMGMKDPDDSAYARLRSAWIKKVTSDSLPSKSPAGNPGWRTMQLPIPNGWEQLEGMDGLDGVIWFKTSITVPENWKGKNLLLDLGRIRDMDITWVNGKRIGSTNGINITRLYEIPASVLHSGANDITVQVLNFYDKGGFTGGARNAEAFILRPVGNNTDSLLMDRNWRYFIMQDDPPAFPRYEADYQPFADVYIEFPRQSNVTRYRRQLDITNAIASVSYTNDGVEYKREYFSSAPQQCIAMQLTASTPGQISAEVSLKSIQRLYKLKKVDERTLSISLQVRNGALRGVGYLYVDAQGGTVSVKDNGITVKQANKATFYVVAATNYKSYKDITADPAKWCKEKIAAVKTMTYETVKANHIRDYQQLFNSFSINLPAGKNSALPTDDRIRQFNATDDAALMALYVQYGRYLMIASSRAGTNPANLQGIWNDLLTPPWGSKYTSNINLEMNYWPAELLNLSSCHQPLFKMIRELAEAGSVTAKEHYGAPGWVLHHNTDLWRGSAPINASNHGIWVSGAAWLCHHLWEHYQFTQDTGFLKQYYPIMKDAARFFLHFLVKDPKTGWLISTPSNSPEQGGLVAGPTMDHQIIRMLFAHCIDAAAILRTDADFSKQLAETSKKIAPNKIGRLGQLQEWMEDKDDPNNRHRHVSHLWGVFPGTEITWKDSVMMKAARQSLLIRGDGGTGWSLAWKINLWARFKDGNHTLKMINTLFIPAEDPDGGSGERGGTYRNLFDAHPPFQIDGNFGGAAGIAEMLVQSHDGYIELLPALPTLLPDGEVKGICARGGFQLDIKWAGGKLQQATIYSKSTNEAELRYGSKTLLFKTGAGKRTVLDGNLKEQ